MKTACKLAFLLILQFCFCQIAFSREAREPVDIYLQQLANDTIPYATLYIYRPANTVGGLVGYHINVNDSTVVKIKNNSKAAVKLYREGPAAITVENEDKKVHVHVRFGEAYYIKFGMLSGLVGAKPEINLISPSQAQAEYNDIKDKKSKSKTK